MARLDFNVLWGLLREEEERGDYYSSRFPDGDEDVDAKTDDLIFALIESGRWYAWADN